VDDAFLLAFVTLQLSQDPALLALNAECEVCQHIQLAVCLVLLLMSFCWVCLCRKSRTLWRRLAFGTYSSKLNNAVVLCFRCQRIHNFILTNWLLSPESSIEVTPLRNGDYMRSPKLCVKDRAILDPLRMRCIRCFVLPGGVTTISSFLIFFKSFIKACLCEYIAQN